MSEETDEENFGDKLMVVLFGICFVGCCLFSYCYKECFALCGYYMTKKLETAQENAQLKNQEENQNNPEMDKASQELFNLIMIRALDKSLLPKPNNEDKV